ncbi:MAG TPA: methionyl-tRNA formyltransferase [Pyrinomonadaceae bacterium]|jgi:methionyl-tRNA formyltransferase
MRLIFMGTPEAAVPTLRRCVEDGHEVVAVWTQPDRPAGRGNRLTAPPVKEFALSKGLEVHQPSKIKTDEAFAQFASYEADAAVVVAYGRILPSAFLRAPRRGCVNVHFSLLPKYRGAAPVNWAIVHGERETGVTTMLIDEGLDTGDLLLQRATKIGERETAPELLERLAHEGAELLSETLARLDEIEPQPQRDAEATLAPLLRREDGKIDWTSEASEIERRVRGFQPWPNAYTVFESTRLVVWRAEVAERRESSGESLRGVGAIETEEAGERAGELEELGESFTVEDSLRPGVIAEAQGDSLVVACGGGTSLRLLEVQAEGKRRMSARDFLNGMRVSAGERLG